MKQFIFALLFVGGVLAVANADSRVRGTPVSQTGEALQTADYGGVQIAVSTFPHSGTGVHYSTGCLPCSGTFHGINFSSGTTADWADVFFSTSADMAKVEGAVTRLYNVNGSTGGVGSTASGFSGTQKPIRFTGGLLIRGSAGSLNHLSILYTED